jgi:hypothetical protein
MENGIPSVFEQTQLWQNLGEWSKLAIAMALLLANIDVDRWIDR